MPLITESGVSLVIDLIALASGIFVLINNFNDI